MQRSSKEWRFPTEVLNSKTTDVMFIIQINKEKKKLFVTRHDSLIMSKKL